MCEPNSWIWSRSFLEGLQCKQKRASKTQAQMAGFSLTAIDTEISLRNKEGEIQQHAKKKKKVSYLQLILNI